MRPLPSSPADWTDAEALAHLTETFNRNVVVVMADGTGTAKIGVCDRKPTV